MRARRAARWKKTHPFRYTIVIIATCISEHSMNSKTIPSPPTPQPRIDNVSSLASTSEASRDPRLLHVHQRSRDGIQWQSGDVILIRESLL